MSPTAALRTRLTVFFTIGIAAVLAVALWVVHLPQLLGVGRYEVRVELIDAAGLYPSANVTYRGIEIGRVTDVELTTSGAEAVLSLDTEVAVPMNAPAQIRSMSAVGEQYLEFLPGNEEGPYLSDGAVVAAERVTLPEQIAGALDQLDETLQSVGNDRLATLLNETYTAVGESDEALRTLIDAAAAVSADGAERADAIAALLDQAGPLLETNITASESITQWASALAGTTGQLRESDADIRALLDVAAPAAAQVQAMFEEMEPTMPLLLANLITVEQVAAVYRPSLEQMLVLFPSIMASTQSAGLPNVDNPSQNTFFVNSYNDPPPCIEGFLPPEQRRSPTELDVPETPSDLYCKLPADSPIAVRGARNMPCIEYPGRRAATVQLCRDGGDSATNLEELLTPTG
ncbi:phospholipid/cholesterol/gamma-HCH transport system substrate-binding protein [Rhodococcus sp. SMB37]|uniref:MCE family protein n=1 Tax=Rhodococcus sp. SMB37 TaxID=2512213 RepID=UPI001046D25B|nr:MlaD family protein [Rhodococcus sp. SMB37]TCN43876.1 phospholipid/cholesterol/gamma-HCH transport system substrate-binding protein [Rhodococcus sp. SMB37]